MVLDGVLLVSGLLPVLEAHPDLIGPGLVVISYLLFFFFSQPGPILFLELFKKLSLLLTAILVFLLRSLL